MYGREIFIQLYAVMTVGRSVGVGIFLGMAIHLAGGRKKRGSLREASELS